MTILNGVLSSDNYILIAGKTVSRKNIAFVQPAIDPGDPATRVTYWGGATVELDAATDYVVAKLGLR